MGKRIKDLSQGATEADLVSGNYFALDGSTGTKKLGANVLINGTLSKTFKVVNLNDTSLWFVGAINGSTGNISSDSTRLTSQMIPFRDGIASYTPASGVSLATTTYCYDKDENYLGYSLGDLSYSSLKTTYPSAVYFRITLRSITGTSVSVDNLPNIATFDETYHEETFESFEGGQKNSKDIENAYGEVFDKINLNNTSHWYVGGVDASTGRPASSSTRITTEQIPFAGFVEFNPVKGTGVSFSINYYCYDEDKNYLGYTSGVSNFNQILNTYPKAYFFRCSLMNLSGTTVSLENFSNIATFSDNLYLKKYAEKEYVDRIVADAKSSIDDVKSPINLNDSSVWNDYSINATTGFPSESSTRLTTDLLPFSTDTILNYTPVAGVTFGRIVYVYDYNNQFLGWRQLDDFKSIASQISGAYRFRISLTQITGATVSAANLANIVTFNGSYYVVETGVKRKADISFENSVEDVLKGKKWYACGDSFTQGFAQYKLTSGKYMGENAVYPYIIGNRTGMDVHNIAVSGSTIAYKEGVSTEANCFSVSLYQSIPADADYITLKFGINDGHRSIPIGDVTDETNETVCGAWNVVLEYLITKCPYAKIGVIVSNGCDTQEYSKAARDCAERWGIAYLDENFDYKVPLLHRVNGKPLVCADAHALRLAAFRVSENDTHPNTNAHEFESTFVENWLRSL